MFTGSVVMSNVMSSSFAGSMADELSHYSIKDFRPVSNGSIDTLGSGAYDAAQAGSGEYWIPGAQSYRASRPIPMDEAEHVALSADLIFLPGRTRNTYPTLHRVFVACSTRHLEYQVSQPLTIDYDNNLPCRCEHDDGSFPTSVAGNRMINGVEEDAVCGKGQRYSCPNIFRVPKDLARYGKTIFWRVDTIMTTNGHDSARIEGPTWSFTYGHSRPSIRPMGPCDSPENCKMIYQPMPEVPKTPPSLFHELDSDSSGSLSIDEIMDGLLFVGSHDHDHDRDHTSVSSSTMIYELNEAELLETFQGCRGMDIDGDGEVSLSEFVSRPLPDPASPPPPVPALLTWVTHDISTGVPISVVFRIYEKFPTEYKGCAEDQFSDEPEETENADEDMPIAPDPPPEMCASGSSETFDCNFYINIRCRDFVSKAHTWSKAKQREYLSLCMAQDCEQSLEEIQEGGYSGCRYMDENGFCYSKEDSQKWCSQNPTSIHCLNTDGGEDWAASPLGSAPSSSTKWQPWGLTGSWNFRGREEGRMSCACMKHCTCTPRSNSWKCYCVDDNQGPVGPGTASPTRIIRSGSKAGKCACLCEEDVVARRRLSQFRSKYSSLKRMEVKMEASARRKLLANHTGCGRLVAAKTGSEIRFPKDQNLLIVVTQNGYMPAYFPHYMAENHGDKVLHILPSLSFLQDRVVLRWQHMHDLDLWVFDGSNKALRVGWEPTTAEFAGGTMRLDLDSYNGLDGPETIQFQSLASGVIEIWVHYYNFQFTKTQTAERLHACLFSTLHG